MTPNGNLTADGVRLMMIEEINRYDVGNSKRHEENSKKMEQIKSLLMKIMWGIIMVGLTAAAGLFTDIIIHSMGK